MQRFLLSLLILSLCDICQTSQANESPRHFNVHHVEGKGLGYAEGYTSIGAFYAVPDLCETFIPFADLRGHIFNDSKFAATAGFGLRYQSDWLTQIWGINAYYDFREESRQNYHQVGGGLEILGAEWGLRANSYWPVDRTHTNIYRFNYTDHLPFGFGLRAREQLALRGVDTLFSYRFCNPCFHGEIGAGPYYYWGKSAKTKNAFTAKTLHGFGGRLSLNIFLIDYFSIEAATTYDSLFQWGGQGIATITIPFDLFNFWYESSCCLSDRLYDSPKRNEIITVDHITRFTRDPRVLDPDFHP